MRLVLTGIMSAAICVAAAFGQSSISAAAGPNGPRSVAHFDASREYTMRAVTGAPYSADQVAEHVQTLGDGTHITQPSRTTKVYRDSSGRTRTERPFLPMRVPGTTQDSPVIIEIMDPVAGVRYTLDTSNKVAHRQQLSDGPGGRVTAGGGGATRILPNRPSEENRPEMVREKLGTQTIEGELAEGTRYTTTWPIGSQGNDRPLSMVSETWMSPELKVIILSHITDSRSGESTRKLTNISRAEPPLTLFQPPPDYTVVDETGEFSIEWGAKR